MNDRKARAYYHHHYYRPARKLSSRWPASSWDELPEDQRDYWRIRCSQDHAAQFPWPAAVLSVAICTIICIVIIIFVANHAR